ncbi:MAG: biotin synthase BioB [Proteobacteria bacterium]|nr:biotin synthase BioB [Pseudomonadota bacterium]
MDIELKRLTDKAIAEKAINPDDAVILYNIGKEKPFLLMAYASEVRDYYKGRQVSLCSIVNAKSGLCPENCRFCAQSTHHHTHAEIYPLIPKDEIIEKAKAAKECGAHMFSIVTSGTRIEGNNEWNEIEEAIRGMVRVGIKPCASIGMLDEERAQRLKEAGLFRYHHNLETSRSNFDAICSTHDYEDDIETVKNAKKAGLSVCSGGIIGLGETMEQRIEMAFTLKELDVDSVPINILNPIEGTPLAHMQPLAPVEILITIALYRFILPDKDIKLCGGKEKNLRQLLPLGIVAGCNSLMTGDYLTTLGRDAASDIEMIKDLGFTVDSIPS